MGGNVVGFLGNNSSVDSGQIDRAAARKGTRFVRFCNLYNIPMIFLEDVAGFMPGRDQESRGIILEGRRLLDSIIDLRVPTITLIIRNAIGGAYAAYNSHFVGADLVLAMPMARIAVMTGGPRVRLQGRAARRRGRLPEGAREGRGRDDGPEAPRRGAREAERALRA